MEFLNIFFFYSATFLAPLRFALSKANRLAQNMSTSQREFKKRIHFLQSKKCQVSSKPKVFELFQKKKLRFFERTPF